MTADGVEMSKLLCIDDTIEGLIEKPRRLRTRRSIEVCMEGFFKQQSEAMPELHKDKARLDWLDSVESSHWWHDNGNAVFDIPGRPGELRQAIDAAMDAQI